MAVLGDARLFDLLEREGPAIARGDAAAHDRGVVAELVERCAWAKVEVVTADERERGVDGGRITLNLGHSLGHAVEAAAGYDGLLHGEAVAYGLRAATRIGVACGVTPPARAARIGRLLDTLELGRDAPPLPPRRGPRPPGDGQETRRWRAALGPADRRWRRGPIGRARLMSSSGRGRCPARRRERRDDDACWSSRARTSTSSGRASPRSTATTRSRRSTPGSSDRAAELGLTVDFFQSNHEGALIDRLHERDFDVAVVNAGGLTHTSVSLRDALVGVAATVHRGPPVGPVDARVVPARQLPARRRARVDRRAGGPRLPPRARVDRRADSGHGVADRRRDPTETAELRRLRRRIDRARQADRGAPQRASDAGARGGSSEGRGRPPRDPGPGSRARGAAAGLDGQRGPAAAGRPAGPLPAAVRRDAGARDAAIASGARADDDGRGGGTGDGRP